MKRTYQYLCNYFWITVIGLIVMGAVFIGCIFVAIYGNIFAGLLLMAVPLIAIIYGALIQPFFIELDAESIRELTLIKRVKKEKQWGELTAIKLLTLDLAEGGRFSSLSNYCCLFFTENIEEFQYLNDMRREDDIMVFEYVEGLEEVLKEYTDIAIIDERKEFGKKKKQ